jgi:hypothetical protein
MSEDLPYPMWKIREPEHAPVSILCQYPEPVVLETVVQPEVASTTASEPKVDEAMDLIDASIPDLQLSQIVEDEQQPPFTAKAPESQLKQSAALNLAKVRYVENVDTTDLTPDMKDKMMQLLNMGCTDFDTNLIALFQASGALDLACSTIMKH